MNHSRLSVGSLLLYGAFISTATLVAQIPATNGTFLLAMAANAKQRITVTRKGNPTEPIIDQVRFGADGQMQRTTISAPQQKEMHGLRGRVAAGVKEDVKQMMELAGRYNKPQQIATAIQKAHISQSADMIRLEANGLIESTDSMIMLVDPATHLATRVNIKTDCDGGPMTISQDYAPIPGGPTMMKSMRVSAPKKDLVVNVDSFDYARQSAALYP